MNPSILRLVELRYWVLEAVTKLSKPILCKGAQVLWVLPAEIETLIWLDLAESDLAIKLKGVQS